MGTNTSQKLTSIKELFQNGKIDSALLELRSIVSTSLKVLDYQKINKLIDEHRDRLLAYFEKAPLRIAILGGYTTQPLAMSIRATLFAEGHLVDIYESEYNSYKMEVLNPNSGLYAFRPDIVLFATGSMNIELFPVHGTSRESVSSLIDSFVTEYESLWKTVKDQTGASIIQHNFEPLHNRTLGRLESKYCWATDQYIEGINQQLWKFDGREIYILDTAWLAKKIGINNWFEPRWYHHSKHGFDPNLTFEYARLFIGLFRAIKGKAKKCLVVDLDNTLWGGIIGDDGLNGIHLGNISAQGEAYAAFCRYLKGLKQRGIILAVNSKNDPGLAKEVFLKHPEMPLKLDDFSSFYSNWDNKSSNLKNIVKDLNIGIDSVVFIDDNPVECEEVRRMLPEVSVIEMSGDPAYFIRHIDQMHFFDQLNITDEDLKRSDSYTVQGKISTINKTSANLDEFLAGLDMTSIVQPSTLDDIPRIEQMFKKTNQFNCTSRSYDYALLSQFIDQENKFCISCWLKDKFVNYGLVSVLVGDIEGEKLRIDNWVMSCRVFSRSFEQFIFNKLIKFAAELNCSGIESEFIPTARNSYIKNLYPKLGFELIRGGDKQQWICDLAKTQELKTNIKEQLE
jgi:FkbH-like protein